MYQHQLRAFGLAFVVALGLMAFMAVAAQAEETLEDGGKAANFLIQKLTSLAKPGVTFEVNQAGTGTLLVPGRYDILCTSGTVAGEFKSSTEALFGAVFTGCTIWSPVTTFPHVTKLACTVATTKEGKEKEKVIIVAGIALPKKHGGAPYVLVEEDGGPFTTIFLVGPECPLTLENKVTASVVGKVINSDTAAPTIEFNQAIQKLFQVENKETKVIKGDQYKVGTFQAYLDGAGTGKLTDAAHAGFTLGVC